MSVKNLSVLVTGGAGFIGSHLVDRLIQDDPRKIVVVDNYFLGQEANLAQAKSVRPDIDVIRLDASNLAAMQDVVEHHEVEYVFDLAVVPLPTSLLYPEWTVATNIGIATTFCELARRGSIAKLLHVSSSEAYGSARYVPMDEDHPLDAITPYAASKAAGDRIIESYVQTFGIAATTVRPFNNFGPRQNPGSYAGIIPILIQRIQAGLPIEIHGDGQQSRDFLFVRETAEMIVRSIETDACGGQTINVASGYETTVSELVKRILRVMGIDDYPIVHTPERLGDVKRHCADVTLAVDLLHLEQRPMSDAELAETVNWYGGRLK